MNAAQLKEIVKKAYKDDLIYVSPVMQLLEDFYRTGSEANYKKILDLHKKISTKREALTLEIDKRMEKYRKDYVNNREAYNTYEE